MTVLLDENLPQRLRHLLPNHDVTTVAFRGWSGKTNGALIALCEETGIDVIVTSDKNLSYQQNLRGRHLALVVVPSNDLEVLRGMTDVIGETITAAAPGSYLVVKPFPGFPGSSG